MTSLLEVAVQVTKKSDQFFTVAEFVIRGQQHGNTVSAVSTYVSWGLVPADRRNPADDCAGTGHAVSL